MVRIQRVPKTELRSVTFRMNVHLRNSTFQPCMQLVTIRQSMPTSDRFLLLSAHPTIEAFNLRVYVRDVGPDKM